LEKEKEKTEEKLDKEEEKSNVNKKKV